MSALGIEDLLRRPAPSIVCNDAKLTSVRAARRSSSRRSSEGGALRYTGLGLLAVVWLFATPELALALCSDPTALSAARAQIVAHCDCDGVSSHRAYVACATKVAAD